MSTNNLPDDSFRDSISTIDEEGKRAYIFPKKPVGRFYDKRKLVSYFLLAFLLSAPFIKINGNQFLMFNVLERKFSIFGFPFSHELSELKRNIFPPTFNTNASSLNGKCSVTPFFERQYS